MLGSSISFTRGVTGSGRDISLTGQPGLDNSFTLIGPISVSNITVTGNSTGNNLLAVDAGSIENWSITGVNLGNLSVSGLTGNLAFNVSVRSCT
ncbi:MAG: hypothetical protein WAW86_04830 [Gammaproteobacteria bacterium]